MKYKFPDLVDIPRLQALMEALYLATEIPSGIFDTDGNIIVDVGWREICRNFHRKNPNTESLCRKSNKNIMDHLQEAETYIWEKCLNGLIDAAAPIVIDGKHVATVFYGQFLFKNADVEYFRSQARKYGFNETEYLAALAKVPICSKDKLDSIMKYFVQLANMLGELGLARLKQLKLQAKKMEEIDHQLFRVFNNTPNVAIQGYDVNGYITFWNVASENIYGFTSDEVVDRCVDQIFKKEPANKIIQVIKKVDTTDEPQGPEEWYLNHKDGSPKTVYSTLFPVKLFRGKEFICMDVDITEKKNFEKEFFRLDRLNLIGEMAASIGHEVRNPMTTVRGYLQILRNKDYLNCYREQFDLMIDELDRANQIIKEFLTLARNKTIDKKMQSLTQIISQMQPLIYADAINDNKVVNIILNEVPDLPLDEKEIRQLLLNLIRNGLESLAPAGTLSIETFQDEGEVVLRVRDNGSGIPKEIIDKIGTPFFTTKPQGTGLGLAICYSIATRHQGRIVVDSDSSGTDIYVRFTIPATLEQEQS